MAGWVCNLSGMVPVDLMLKQQCYSTEWHIS